MPKGQPARELRAIWVWHTGRRRRVGHRFDPVAHRHEIRETASEKWHSCNTDQVGWFTNGQLSAMAELMRKPYG